MGQQAKAKAKRRLLAKYKAEWVPRALNTLPQWRWLTQLCAWMELQRISKRGSR